MLDTTLRGLKKIIELDQIKKLVFRKAVLKMAQKITQLQSGSAEPDTIDLLIPEQ